MEIEDFRVPTDFYCILDMDEGYLAFCLKNMFLGVAFRGLKGKTLYPIIGAVWGHCEVSDAVELICKRIYEKNALSFLTFINARAYSLCCCKLKNRKS